jgi:hypothetical protein
MYNKNKEEKNIWWKNDEYAKKHLSGKKASTQSAYAIGLKLFCNFYNMTPTQLIDEAQKRARVNIV